MLIFAQQLNTARSVINVCYYLSIATPDCVLLRVVVSFLISVSSPSQDPKQWSFAEGGDN